MYEKIFEVLTFKQKLFFKFLHLIIYLRQHGRQNILRSLTSNTYECYLLKPLKSIFI